MSILVTSGPDPGGGGSRLRSRIRGKSVVELARRGSGRAKPSVCVDAGNTIFMLMPRASGSVFKLCKSNINAKPVINNLSASRGKTRSEGGRGGRGRREVEETRRSVRTKDGALRREKRQREKKREGYREAMGRGYIIPALGPSAFAFENKMRKHGPRSVPLPRVPADKDDGGHDGGRRGSGRNAEVSSEKGRRSFDPSLTGPLLASFSLVTRIPRPSNQIIVLEVDSVPTWKQRDTYTRLE